jgi:hypothetical protein
VLCITHTVHKACQTSKGMKNIIVCEQLAIQGSYFQNKLVAFCYSDFLSKFCTSLDNVLQLLVTANVVPGLLILLTLMMEAMLSSKTLVLTRPTWCHIPEHNMLHSHRCRNLTSSMETSGPIKDWIPESQLASRHTDAFHVQNRANWKLWSGTEDWMVITVWNISSQRPRRNIHIPGNVPGTWVRCTIVAGEQVTGLAPVRCTETNAAFYIAKHLW